jgi:hypothetical protein
MGTHIINNMTLLFEINRVDNYPANDQRMLAVR